MSDIQEEQKRLYKRTEENDLKATMKPLFPEDVEMVCISKNDYDRLYGDLSYKNIELQDRINKAIEYIWSTKYEYGDLEEDNEDFDIDVYELLNILKGDNK